MVWAWQLSVLTLFWRNGRVLLTYFHTTYYFGPIVRVLAEKYSIRGTTHYHPLFLPTLAVNL